MPRQRITLGFTSPVGIPAFLAMWPAFLAMWVMMAALAAPASAADTVRLKLHHFLATSSVTHAGFLAPWARKVETESGGRIRIDIYPAMQLGGKPPQLYDQARDGVVDLVWTLPGYTAGRFPLSEVFELPFVAGSAEATSQALTAFHDRHLRAEFADVKVILLHAHAPGSFHMAKRRIRTLEDMKGVKIRAPSRVTLQALKALGATPIGMPVPEVPQMLMTGVIDGALLPFEVTLPLRVHELTRYHTETGLYTARFLLAMNKARYDALPADLKAVIDANSGLALARRIGRLWDAAEEPGRQKARARGNEIHRLGGAEIRRWKRVTQPVIDNWIAAANAHGRDGAAMLAEARALIAEYSQTGR